MDNEILNTLSKASYNVLWIIVIILSALLIVYVKGNNNDRDGF